MVSEWDIGGKDKRMNEYAVERLLDALQSLTLEVQLFREAYVAHNSPRLERIDEPQTIRCPKCGRSDYIREFGKDFSVTAEEAGFKYKCINCNTYIEPQTERSE